MADDDVDRDPPEDGRDPARGFTAPGKHVAADRAATLSLREAARLGEVLAESGVPEEPVVLDRRGPHRSIGALDRLLADALDEDEDEAGPGRDRPP